MCHSFQGRKPEAFIERRKDKYLCLVVKDPQHFDWNESQKSDFILDAAPHNRAPEIGITREVVPDNDQLQVGVELVFLEFSLERGKSFDHAYNVLVRADAAC